MHIFFKALIATCLLIASPLSWHNIYSQNPSSGPFPGDNPKLYTFCLDEDKETVFYSDGKFLFVSNLNDFSQTSQYSIELNSDIFAIAVSKNKTNIYLGTMDGRIYCFDRQAEAFTQTVNTQGGRITSLTLSGDDEFLISSNESGTVLSHLTSNLSASKEIYQHPSTITRVLSNTAIGILAIGGADGLLVLLDEQTHKLINKVDAGKKCIRDLTFDNNKARLVAVGDDGYLRTWNISSLQNPKLLSAIRIESSQILSVDVDKNASLECWGTIDHQLKAKIPFASYSLKLKGPVLKVAYIKDQYEEFFIVCVYGQGISKIPMTSMKMKM